MSGNMSRLCNHNLCLSKSNKYWLFHRH